MGGERIRPKRQEDETGDDERQFVKGKRRHIAVPMIERKTRDERSDAGGACEDSKHRAEYLAVGFKAEIAADEKAHEVDLAAQGGATEECAEERHRLRAAAREQQGPDHRQNE